MAKGCRSNAGDSACSSAWRTGWNELRGAEESLQNRKNPGNLSDSRLPQSHRCRYTGAEFEALARSKGVQIFGAERFAVGNTLPARAVRLSVCSPINRNSWNRALGF